MENGTNPETFVQFMLGLFAQNYMTIDINYIIVYIFAILLFLKIFCKLDINDKNKYIIFKYLLVILIGTFILQILFYWGRYQLFGIR